MGRSGDLIVREWPLDWPGTRTAVERAAQLGQLVEARRTVRAGREVVQVVLRGQAVEPAPPRRPLASPEARRVATRVAGAAAAIGGAWLIYAGAEWATVRADAAAAAASNLATDAISWVVRILIGAAVVLWLIRKVFGR